MKTNAIVRIVLFSLAIFILLAILLAGLGIGLYTINVGVSDVHSEESDAEFVSVDMVGSVSAPAVENISVDWVSGSVVVKRDDIDEIRFTESDVSDEKDKMVWKLDGNTLKIQYCKENMSLSFPSFGINFSGDLSKDLIITVPRDWDCDTLEIDCASASVEIHEMTIREMDFDGASGTCSFYNCAVDSLDLDTASGDVDFTGTLNSLDCDAASANCEINVSNVPEKIAIDSASGDLNLTLPEECGFVCDIDSMSGYFSSDFETTISNGRHTYGDESCHINVTAMSGDVSIYKGSSHHSGHHAK